VERILGTVKSQRFPVKWDRDRDRPYSEGSLHRRHRTRSTKEESCFDPDAVDVEEKVKRTHLRSGGPAGA